MADNAQEIELVFEPQDEGGYHVYAPPSGSSHPGDDLDDANEAVALYVEGLREDGRRLL